METKEDYKNVYTLVKKAFATTTFSDGSEPDYLNELREKDNFIPELSLVAETIDKEIIGQITLTKTSIVSNNKNITQLLLSPICVDPNHFNEGIATQLMSTAFTIAKKMGYSLVFLCGNPDFYSKFDFKPTYIHNIFHIKDEEKNANWCMVKEIRENSLKKFSGIIDIV